MCGGVTAPSPGRRGRNRLRLRCWGRDRLKIFLQSMQMSCQCFQDCTLEHCLIRLSASHCTSGTLGHAMCNTLVTRSGVSKQRPYVQVI